MALVSEIERKEVAVVGAFRTGTNYTRAALETNFNATARYNVFGWKHGFVPVFAKGCDIKFPDIPDVFLTKDPYAFLPSLFRFHKLGPNSTDGAAEWSDFLRSRLVVFDGRRSGSVELRFSNPVDYWNSLYWNHWSATKSGRLMHLQYERALSEPEQAFGAVAANLGLERITEEFEVPSGSVKKMADTEKAREGGYEIVGAKGNTREFRPEKYTDKLYLEMYSDADLRFVRDNLDAELCENLGYSRSAS